MRRPTVGYGAVVVAGCVAAASLLRWLFDDAADPVPFITYFPAIVVSTLLAGWMAGLVATFASMAVVNLVFMQPRLTVWGDWQVAAMMGMFVLSCAMLVAIAQTLRVTVARLQAATDRAEFLNRELLHRGRNSLAIVNSLATLTFQADPARFPAVFSKRMAALASGLDLLSQHGGDRCDLRETVEQACAPFAHQDRLEITGESCELSGSLCVPLTLALHELCTNATKYGAFSQPQGKVTIAISTDSAAGEARLVWQERGGPPVVKSGRTGLGSALLAHPALGPATLVFDPQGLRCEMRLEQLVAPAGQDG